MMEEAGEVAKILLEWGFVLLGILGLVVVERVFYPPLCPAVGLWKLALQKAHLACAKEKDPFPHAISRIDSPVIFPRNSMTAGLTTCLW